MPQKSNIVAVKRGSDSGSQSEVEVQASPATKSDQAVVLQGVGMNVSGRLKATIKINELPQTTQTQNGWHQFTLDCDGKQESVTVRPKNWNKFKAKADEYPMWVAAIAGKVGEMSSAGFVLEQPNIQVFEKKPKAEKKE